MAASQLLMQRNTNNFQQEEQLKNYFKTYKSRIERNYSSCSYVNDESPSARDISNWFIAYNFCPGNIIAFSGQEHSRLPKTESTFIFMESVQEIKARIGDLKLHPFWSSRQHNHFILCRTFNTHKLGLHKLLEKIWTENILNFVLVFVDSANNLQIFSYDPFTSTIMDFRRGGEFLLFPDKLADLHGYKLRVSLFVDFPLTVHEHGKWRGRDYETVKLIAEMLNATFEIIVPSGSTEHFGAYDNMTHGQVDYLGISHFYFLNIFEDAEFTYPHQTNAIVAILPAHFSKKTENLLHIFRWHVWFLLAVIILLISIIIRKQEEVRKRSYSGGVLEIVGSLLGSSALVKFTSRPLAVKLIGINFVLVCIIVRTAFQCSLISSFISPKAVHTIDSIAELRRSAMEVYSTGPLISATPEEYQLGAQFVKVSRQARLEILNSSEEKNCKAMVMAYNAVEKFLRIQKWVEKKTPFYYIMKEAIVPGVDVYMFQKHSPYIDRINRLILIEKQFDLLKRTKDGEVKVARTSSNKNNNVVLGVFHLRIVFFLLVYGLVASFVCFLTEMIFYMFIS